MRYVILISFLFAQTSMAGQCDMFAKVQSAGLYENAAFWDDFAKAGSPLDSRLDKLIEKYHHSADRDIAEAPSTNPQPISHHSSHVEVLKKAEKGLLDVPPNVQNKLDKLISMANEDSSNALIQKLKTKGWDYHPIPENLE